VCTLALAVDRMIDQLSNGHNLQRKSESGIRDENPKCRQVKMPG
jgi:hypothetical protein